MEHLERVEHVVFAQQPHYLEHLARCEAELGRISAGLLPAARAARIEASAYSDHRLDAGLFGALKNYIEFFHLLDNYDELLADAKPQKSEFYVGLVFEAVADNEQVGRLVQA